MTAHNPSSRKSKPPVESYGTYRPGRAACECQFDHWCDRIGRMHDGMFMCGECWRRVGHRKATFGGIDPLAETER